MTIATEVLGLSELEEVTGMFDAYRMFYGQVSDLHRAREFMQDRLSSQDSCVIGAYSSGRLVGFTQLYPSFSSVAMSRKWILNDMFVSPEYRKMGAAEKLLDHATKVARESHAVSMVLATKQDNTIAQSVYEANGWSREQEFVYYNFSVT